MNSVEKQAVLHCLRSMIDEEVCEECPLYGTTGTDHCEKDCVRLAIKALEQEQKIGHWECNELFYNGESRGAIITCSKCGNEFKVSPKVFENLYSNERFCNYCGARMESEMSK